MQFGFFFLATGFSGATGADGDLGFDFAFGTRGAVQYLEQYLPRLP
jgi:hypothetical protein